MTAASARNPIQRYVLSQFVRVEEIHQPLSPLCHLRPAERLAAQEEKVPKKLNNNAERRLPMQNLTRAHNKLYRRYPDESFASLADLWEHCKGMKRWSSVKWVPPAKFAVEPSTEGLSLQVQGQPMALTDWSFTELCSLTGLSKDTVNRLSPETATRGFAETWPGGSKPLQVFAAEDSVRSVHQASYTRRYNVELLTTIREFAVGFQPPQHANTGTPEEDGTPPATGCTAESRHVLLPHRPDRMDRDRDEAFAPGFFVWNSEAG